MSARPRASLQGDLARFAPEIVLQILALARADGALVLQGAGARGEVFLRGGKIVAAQLGPGRGQRRRAGAAAGSRRGRTTVPAPAAPESPSAAPQTLPASPEQVRDTLATLLGWRQGTFSFQHGATAGVEGAPLEVEGLLLECMTRMDRVRGGLAGQQGG